MLCLVTNGWWWFLLNPKFLIHFSTKSIYFTASICVYNMLFQFFCHFRSPGEITTSFRSPEADNILGNRLLARAQLRRKRISQQLANIPSERIHVDPAPPSIPAPHCLDGISPSFSTNQCSGSQGPLVAGRPPRAQTTLHSKCMGTFLLPVNLTCTCLFTSLGAIKLIGL